ncbi:hypothetical protein I4U23_021997 [Adineta vaga]|nr:hypothetical protein I4U23_021997 [Adineta vaga]
MTVFFRQRNAIELEQIGEVATIPDNDVAHLMYYLKSVCFAIDCANDSNIQRFTNYKRWFLLSLDEQKTLLLVCYTYSPDVLNN